MLILIFVVLIVQNSVGSNQEPTSRVKRTVPAYAPDGTGPAVIREPFARFSLVFSFSHFFLLKLGMALQIALPGTGGNVAVAICTEMNFNIPTYSSDGLDPPLFQKVYIFSFERTLYFFQS